MRFSAAFSDQGSVEAFNKCLQAISHMGRKRCALKITPDGMCFICSPTTGVSSKDGVEFWCGVLVPYSPTFASYSFAGLTEDKNEIILEIIVDDLLRCLSQNHSNSKIKLTNKNNSPHLRVELRSINMVHDIPVTIIQSKKWPLYDRPATEDVQCSLYLPPTRTIQRVFKSLKNTSTKFVSWKANSEGELQLHSSLKHGQVSIFFTDLQNDTAANGNESENWVEAKMHVKPLNDFFHNFGFAHSRIKLSLLSSRLAEFSLCQEEFEVSFVIGELKD